MKKKTKTITIRRLLKTDKALKRYLEDNMWYRRKVYNIFVEKFIEWDSSDVDTRRKSFNTMGVSTEIHNTYELENPNYSYYCTGIRDGCRKDFDRTKTKLHTMRNKGVNCKARFKSYDKFHGNFTVDAKVKNKSAKCMILDDTHIRFTFNANNIQILELAEPLKYDFYDIDDCIMSRTFANERYIFQNKNLKEVTFVKKFNKFYIHLTIKVEILDYEAEREFLAGIDLGLRNPVTICFLDKDGKKRILKLLVPYDTEKRIKHLERRKNRLQEIMNMKYTINKERVKKGEIPSVYTNNYEKLRKKYRITCKKIYNIKRDWRLKTIHYIVTHYDNIVVDEFNNPISKEDTRKVKRLNKFNTRLSMSYFMEDLHWMANRYNCNFIESPPNSTRTCCWCGFVNEHLKLGKKYLKCSACGTVTDRDVNAAANCFNYGLIQVNS